MKRINKKLFALVRTADGRQVDLCYLLGESVKGVWAAVIEEEWLGTRHTVRSLQKLGWRARPIRLEVLR